MRYTLVHGGGEVTLNSTFARRKRNIGGLGGNVMNRQRDSGQWVKTGDGLPTPEIVVLEGMIFSEARDLSLMRAEAAQIATAVSGVTAIKEVSSIGTTTISGFLGGARPSITQEDRYLWKVKLELYIATEIQSFEPLVPPADLAATGGNNKVDLTWTDAALSDLAKVNIYRGTTSGSLSLIDSVNAGVQAYQDSTAINDTTYYYAVSSVLTSGPESSLSSEVSATPVGVQPFGFQLDSPFGGKRALLFSPGSSDWPVVRWNAVPLATNMETLTRINILDDNDRGNFTRFFICGSGAANNESGYYLEFYKYIFQSYHIVELRLKEVVNGSSSQFMDFSFDWSELRWYWVRFRRNGTQLQAKVWRDGTPEPTPWSLSATLSSPLSAGWAAVGGYLPRDTSIDSFGVGLNGAAAPAYGDILSADQYLNDFSQYPDNTVPGDFSTPWGADSLIYKAHKELPLPPVDWLYDDMATNNSNGKGFSWFGESLAYNVSPSAPQIGGSMLYPPLGALSDSETLMLVRDDNNSGVYTGGRNGPVARASANPTNDKVTGYRLLLNVGSYSYGEQQLSIEYENEGAVTVLTSIPFTASLDTFYWLRFSVIGNQLRGKAWQYGTPEPASWQVSAVDTQLTDGGYCGVYMNGGLFHEVSYLAVLPGGGTIPLPPAV